ncbi:MAG: Anti-sigma factor antagonist, partial [Acidimicrobiaceae bacterium]|nr:Anti-sigma factor antagonist [Acidimicrobiaceae bacterium]
LVGELDLATAPILASTANRASGPGMESLTLDLSALSFADLVGLRAIDRVIGMAEAAGAATEIVGLSPMVRRVMEIVPFAHLDRAYQPER